MAIKWEAYDAKNWFELFDAACLWLEYEPSGGLVRNLPSDIDALYREMRSQFLKMKRQSPDYFRESTGLHGGEQLVSPMNLLYFKDYKVYSFFHLIKRQALIEYANLLGQRPKLLFPEERVSFGAVPDPKNNEFKSTPPNKGTARRIDSWRKLVKTIQDLRKHHKNRWAFELLNQVA